MPYFVIMEAAGVRLPVAPLGLGSGFTCQVAPLPFLLADRHCFELFDQLIQVFAAPGQFEQLEPFGFPCQLFNDLGGVCHFVHVLTSFLKSRSALPYTIYYKDFS